MPSISQTIARLAAARGRTSSPPDTTRLSPLEAFGSNPGALDAHFYVPEALAPGAPLVVVLHGCTQTAAGYDHGSGWSTLAERHGFAVLYPEQRTANNANRCFDWFTVEDTRRGSGEALSIRQMVETMVGTHRLDPARVFVTGLSAGGAMTSVMLATYPDVFAGGAIIAGLPFGSAIGIPQALERMRGQGGPAEDGLADLVRDASPCRGPWPTLSIWHGSSDHVVAAGNAEAILAQWRPLHGVSVAPDHVDEVDGYPHRVWTDRNGRAVIEQYSITGMGHGTPLCPDADDGCGTSGAYMLSVDISSTQHIAAFWGIAPRPQRAASERSDDRGRKATAAAAPRANTRLRAVSQAQEPSGVSAVIENALRSAGLMQ